QAEDGIRDATVTGVQTCALPIFGDRKPERDPGIAAPLRGECHRLRAGVRHVVRAATARGVVDDVSPGRSGVTLQPDKLCDEARRSEERRVGKEGGCGGAREW